MIKVLHVITGLGTGGAEIMLERLTTLSGPEVQHEVISLRGMGTVGERLRAAGIRVFSIDMVGTSAPRAFARLVVAVRRSRPDVVQTWMYHADVIGGLAARIASVRAIAWGVRTADIRPGISLKRGAMLMLRTSAWLSRSLPQRIVYVAEAARRSHEEVGYDPAKSTVIHNGFALPDRAALIPVAAEIRKAAQIPANALLIGTAGTFTAQKNQVGFVAACAPLLQRRDDVHIALIGRGCDASNPVLTAAIAATGVPGRFHLLGERRDVPACLVALDLFCLASRGEGFPNVVGEAMAVGTPVLVTDVGDAALLVGEMGSVVPADDAPALAAGLAGLADLPRAELAARGAAARTRIEGNFTMAQAKDRYLMLYRSLLAERDRA